MRAHGHGPAARAGGRQRARGARGGRDAARRRAAGPRPSSSSTPARTCSRSRISASTTRRGGGARSERSPTDRRSTAYERWVRAQGGDPDVSALPRAPLIREVSAPRGGYVRRLAALPVGLAALELGAGRLTKDDPVDHAVGVVCVQEARRRGRGGRAARGDPRAATRRLRTEAAAAVLAAYELGDDAPPPTPIVLDTIA